MTSAAVIDTAGASTALATQDAARVILTSIVDVIKLRIAATSRFATLVGQIAVRITPLRIAATSRFATLS